MKFPTLHTHLKKKKHTQPLSEDLVFISNLIVTPIFICPMSKIMLAKRNVLRHVVIAENKDKRTFLVLRKEIEQN